jgi:hypothetical protein
MPTLTAEQRKLIIQRLDVWPKPKSVGDKLRAAVNKGHVRDDERILAALDDLDAAEGAVAKAVAEIEKLNHGPDFERAVARFKTSITEMHDALLKADRTDGLQKIEAATRQLARLQGAIRGAIANPVLCVSELAAYEAAAKDVDDLLAQLDAHPQKAHVAGQIAKARDDLAALRRLADEGDFQAATQNALLVAPACRIAIGTADDYAGTVIPLLRTATRALDALRKSLDEGLCKKHAEEIEKARAKAGAPAWDHLDAAAGLNAAIAGLKAAAVKELSEPIKGHLDDLGTFAGGLGAFVADDIKRLGDLKKEVDDAIGRDDVPLAAMIARGGAHSQRIVTLLACERRAKYDGDRADTETELGKLKPHAGVLGTELTKLEAALADADLKADRATMRIEEAIAALQSIESRCLDLRALARRIEGYRKERSDADKRLADLKGLPEAARIGPRLTALDGMLAALPPDTATADSHSADPAFWVKARREIGQATAAILKAGEVAAGLDEVARAQVAAGQDGNAAEVGRAARDLLSLAAAVEGREHASEVAHRTGSAKTNANTAVDLLAAIATHGEDMAGITVTSVAQLVADASRQLEIAVVDLAELKAFHARMAGLSDGRDELATSKKPPASSIRSKLDELDRHLGEAAAQANRKAWDAAATALAAAAEALADAAKAASDRDSFDTLAAMVRAEVQKLPKPADPKFEQGVAAAEGLASTYDFAGAGKALDDVANAVDVALLAAMASSPKKLRASDGEFVTGTVLLLMRAGGDKALDGLVAKLPDDFPPATVARLAASRFGVTMTVEGPLKTDAHDATKSARRIYGMLAMVPNHVKGNASLEEVKRDKADGSGGSFSEFKKLAVVSGRPGATTQKFGAGLVNEDGSPQLGAVDADHEPATPDPVDFFDYATLHEVGHAVDTRLNFMDRNGGKPDHGGWVSYGDIGPIVEAVADGYGYDSAPQKAYIKDLMLGLKPEPPKPPLGDEAAWAAGLKKVQDWHAIATNKKVWWRDGESRKIAIKGRIYHEAYDGLWVSYLEAARDKGITGYQFRAPGEWFAELYACHHSNKLKPGHSALSWLTTL